MRPTQLVIDLAALAHNFQRVRQLAPHSSMIAMVKANAYGHGLERIAQALPQADALGVASFEEAMCLRRAGVKQAIVLMEGLFYPDEWDEVFRQRFTLVVHHEAHVEMIEKQLSSPGAKLSSRGLTAGPSALLGKTLGPALKTARDDSVFAARDDKLGIQKISLWLKINTGMHRLGFDPQQVPDIYQRLLACSGVKQPIGWMTHFAQADTLDSEVTKQQIALFEQVVATYPGPRSLANSAGILAWPGAHADWVRPGLMLYGAAPFAGKTGEDYGLKPVMTLRSQLIAIQTVKRGGRVGYGGEWAAPEELRIGVVGVGYGDGYPQCMPSGTPVLVNGRHCPLVGRVSMDMLTVDLRSQPQAKIGDPVVLWGAGLPVETIAAHSATSAYELLTRMTQRPRVEVSGY